MSTTEAIKEQATSDKANSTDTAAKDNNAQQRQPRAISNPNDVAALVMAQLNNVNGKKDELTIAIKGLMDTTSQLVRAYGEHVKTIQQLQERVKKLEGDNTKDKA